MASAKMYGAPCWVTAERLLFIQRYLTGSDDVVWKPVVSAILRGIAGLGLDASLFLTKCTFIRFCDFLSGNGLFSNGTDLNLRLPCFGSWKSL